MRLKPTTPTIELLLPVLLLFLFAKTLLLGIDRNDGLILIASSPFFLMSIVIVYLINKSFKTIEITDHITMTGYFWGRQKLSIAEIRSFKLKEIRRGKYGAKDFNLILFDSFNKERLVITQGDYKTVEWDSLIRKLTNMKVDFLGQENITDQLNSIWGSIKQRFVK